MALCRLWVCLCTPLVLTAGAANANELTRLAALDSIHTDQLQAYVETLADDSYEGRHSGTRGGRAAANFLAKRLAEFGLAGGGPGGGYMQPFGHGRRNVLAVYPGSDPQLKDQWIVVSAHYDHVGYGNRRTSFGPIGYIHNGADDNASGVAALLEFAEALANHKVPLKRSVLIAFWDGEELGMLGSKHWMRRPTVPVSNVKLAVNIDMIGRLREGRMELVGTRTGYGLRRLASVAEDDELWIDFTWELEPNSDHWTFIEQGIPTVMLHTGLHDDYHRPSDDVEHLNFEGIRFAGRYLFDLTTAATDAPVLPKFRPVGKSETPALKTQRERPLPPLPASGQPPRVGISWREDEAEPGSVYLTRVAQNSPAAEAGLTVHDRILSIENRPFSSSADFERMLHERLGASEKQIRLQVEHRGHLSHTTIVLR